MEGLHHRIVVCSSSHHLRKFTGENPSTIHFTEFHVMEDAKRTHFKIVDYLHYDITRTRALFVYTNRHFLVSLASLRLLRCFSDPLIAWTYYRSDSLSTELQGHCSSSVITFICSNNGSSRTPFSPHHHLISLTPRLSNSCV